jgi:methylthioribose-1-phosphate isomerase
MPAEVNEEHSIYWVDGAIVTIDQRALPDDLRWLRLTTVEEVVDAIRTLAIRGAPAIGAAGALGVAISVLRNDNGWLDTDAVHADAGRLVAARPTAVNLSWAVHRTLHRLPEGPAAVLDEARSILALDGVVNRQAARRAADLVERLCPGRPVAALTHCNTGRLATVAGGTALGAIHHLYARGVLRQVIATETRPLLQGARLTTWELREAGIPHRLCIDSAGASAIARGDVDVVLVGADRIAANGDTANKVGTLPLALAAAHYGIPFIVVAPESTVDPAIADGSAIVIEERRPEEVTHHAGVRVAPAGTDVYNPAFDCTPATLITAIVTESRLLLWTGGAWPVRPIADR